VTANESFVRFGLKLGGVLDGAVVQPDVRDVEAGESAKNCNIGVPSDPISCAVNNSTVCPQKASKRSKRFFMRHNKT
jgi:hypothetical protein